MIEVCPHAKKKIVRIVILALFVLLATTVFFAAGFTPLLADGREKPPHESYIPVAVHPMPAVKSGSAVSLVNQFRTEADIPPVSASGNLSNNCLEHARYMAENNLLAHDQDPNLPFASQSGQSCAQNANAWLGSGTETNPNWTPNDSIHVWMGSVAHRLWLLYPTTQTVGYGFFSTQEEHRAAAAVDILSSANFAADETYAGWPVQYPKGETKAPAARYPITINWRYFGPQPELGNTQLQTADGRILAHDASTDLPAGHKGIQIIPRQDLPPNSQITVTVSGQYEGQPFSYTWSFHSGG